MKRKRLIYSSKIEKHRREVRALNLDNLDLSWYTWREITNMMTTDDSVKKLVLETVKRIIKPGSPVTKTVWKAAYAITRCDAIKDTQAWKRKFITIERT